MTEKKANAAHYARQNPICCRILRNIKRKVPKAKSKRVVGHAISKIKSRTLHQCGFGGGGNGYPFYYIFSIYETKIRWPAHLYRITSTGKQNIQVRRVGQPKTFDIIIKISCLQSAVKESRRAPNARGGLEVGIILKLLKIMIILHIHMAGNVNTDSSHMAMLYSYKPQQCQQQHEPNEEACVR